MVTLTDIETGPDFITIWGIEYPEIREYASSLYSKLPKKLQNINQKDLWRHDPSRFHPNGVHPKRKYFKHFHIELLKEPTDEDILLVKQLINKPNIGVNIYGQ